MTARQDDWPILEFPPLKSSILARFSTAAGESVCDSLIGEIVESVDRPSLVSLRISIENGQELEWIMQFINHAFDLSFHSDTTYRTLSSAVRIYLAWMTAVTSEPHECCPEPLRTHPDRYFRKMIDAFRHIFIPKTLPSVSDFESALCRQGNEIRVILTAVRHLTSSVIDEYKDEIWSRSLLFLMAVTNQLLSETKSKDEIGCLMNNDLSHALFDCWVKAAVLEYIPSPSYWRTLSALTWKWIPHVPVVEWWARKLMHLTVLVVQNLYGNDYCQCPLTDQHLNEALRLCYNYSALKDVWLNMFQLIGNPAHFLRHSETLLDCLPLDASNTAYFHGRASLSFFLSVLTFSKIIDIFYGDSSFSIDLHECYELEALWSDALLFTQQQESPNNMNINVSQRHSASHRSSNLSTAAITVLSTMQSLSNNTNSNTNLGSLVTSADCGTTTVHPSTNGHHGGTSGGDLCNLPQDSTTINNNEGSGNAMGVRKSLINFASLHDAQQNLSANGGGHRQSQGGGSVKGVHHHQHAVRHNSNASGQLSLPPPYPAENAVHTAHPHPQAGQFVWYILKTNRIRVTPPALYGGDGRGPLSGPLLTLFLEWLFDAATIRPIPSPLKHLHLNSAQIKFALNANNDDVASQKSLNVDHLSAGGGGIGTAGTTTMPGGHPSHSSLHHQQSANNNNHSHYLQQHNHQPYGRSSTQDEVVSIGLGSDQSAAVNRRSFATHSTASSSDVSTSAVGSARGAAAAINTATVGASSGGAAAGVFDYPCVDGVTAGRAAALGALCRIVCAKSSDEELADEQLAHFYLVVRQALVDCDRLAICSLLYYSTDLFKLGLRGVELLLPNYLAAIETIMVESSQERLHPSIPEWEMRNACLRALASIVAWPTTFGESAITTTTMGGSGSATTPQTFLELRHRILHIIVHTLRNETDGGNLQLALALCYAFCVENARYDVSEHEARERSVNADDRAGFRRSAMRKDNDDEEEERDGKYFAICALRDIVSAVCDNLCKAQWSNELATCLAALDCLNALAALPHSILFYKDELSTGSLIVTSLCRFVDNQLQKPPMHHSRDLHSSIVAAYFTLCTWISAAPMLTEIESCLSTLAQIIEFGMTGGKSLDPTNYKPASQRVYDAAEWLLNLLFSSSGDNVLSAKGLRVATRTQPSPSGGLMAALRLDDEWRLQQRFGRENVDMDAFRYYLIGDALLVGVHEAQHIHHISGGFPTVFAVCRTPFQRAHTMYFQLRPKAQLSTGADSVCDGGGSTGGGVGSASCVSLFTGGGAASAESPTSPGVVSATSASHPQQTAEKLKSGGSESSSAEPIKQFAFPSGIHKPLCKLDAEFRQLEPIPEVRDIQQRLGVVRGQLSAGGSSTGSEERDLRNVWVQSSLGAILSQPPRPSDSMKSCDSTRVFFYDLGMVNRACYGRTFVPLVFDAANRQQFRDCMHSMVDRTPTRLIETVSIFYVRDGQRNASEILENCEHLERTSAVFCRFLAQLGRGVDVHNATDGGFPHWTGSWRTAFGGMGRADVPGGPLSPSLSSDISHSRTLDGTRNVLYWRDAQVEIAFQTPSAKAASPTTARQLRRAGSITATASAPVKSGVVGTSSLSAVNMKQLPLASAENEEEKRPVSRSAQSLKSDSKPLIDLTLISKNADATKSVVAPAEPIKDENGSAAAGGSYFSSFLSGFSWSNMMGGGGTTSVKQPQRKDSAARIAGTKSGPKDAQDFGQKHRPVGRDTSSTSLFTKFFRQEESNGSIKTASSKPGTPSLPEVPNSEIVSELQNERSALLLSNTVADIHRLEMEMERRQQRAAFAVAAALRSQLSSDGSGSTSATVQESLDSSFTCRISSGEEEEETRRSPKTYGIRNGLDSATHNRVENVVSDNFDAASHERRSPYISNFWKSNSVFSSSMPERDLPPSVGAPTENCDSAETQFSSQTPLETASSLPIISPTQATTTAMVTTTTLSSNTSTLSLVQATSVVIKSARFSPRRRDHFIPTTTVHITHVPHVLATTSISAPLTSTITSEVVAEESSGRQDVLPPSSSTVTVPNVTNDVRLSEVRCNGTAPMNAIGGTTLSNTNPFNIAVMSSPMKAPLKRKGSAGSTTIVAFTPLTSTLIEFPTTASQMPHQHHSLFRADGSPDSVRDSYEDSWKVLAKARADKESGGTAVLENFQLSIENPKNLDTPPRARRKSLIKNSINFTSSNSGDKWDKSKYSHRFRRPSFSVEEIIRRQNVGTTRSSSMVSLGTPPLTPYEKQKSTKFFGVGETGSGLVSSPSTATSVGSSKTLINRRRASSTAILGLSSANALIAPNSNSGVSGAASTSILRIPLATTAEEEDHELADDSGDGRRRPIQEAFPTTLSTTLLSAERRRSSDYNNRNRPRNPSNNGEGEEAAGDDDNISTTTRSSTASNGGSGGAVVSGGGGSFGSISYIKSFFRRRSNIGYIGIHSRSSTNLVSSPTSPATPTDVISEEDVSPSATEPSVAGEGRGTSGFFSTFSIRKKSSAIRPPTLPMTPQQLDQPSVVDENISVSCLPYVRTESTSMMKASAAAAQTTTKIVADGTIRNAAAALSATGIDSNSSQLDSRDLLRHSDVSAVSGGFPSALEGGGSAASAAATASATTATWPAAGLPPIGGAKSSGAWANWRSAGGGGGGTGTGQLLKRQADMRIFVVWLERVEDMYHFPFDQMFAYTNDCYASPAAAAGNVLPSSVVVRQQSSVEAAPRPPDFMVVYLCADASDDASLVRVHTEGVWTRKYGQPAPLMDGMMVPAAVLPALLQQTAAAVARRKMVEVENHQMNHVRRRQAIGEFGRRFAAKMDYAEFLEQFITGGGAATIMNPSQ